jgi:hypothetical protein
MGRSSTAKKSAPRDGASKVARQRLSVLELARELGNVAEACRPRGMDRTSPALRPLPAPVYPGKVIRGADGPRR